MSNSRLELPLPKSAFARALQKKGWHVVIPPVTKAVPAVNVESQAVAITGVGWLPVLFLMTAIGAALTTAAYVAARFTTASWIPFPYWIGVLSIFVPITIRSFQERVGRQERVGLILLLTFGLYLFKISLSPNFLYLSDEFTHWLSTNNILKTHLLFQTNSILQTSAYYPGLHNVSAAFTSLSGLSIFHASILVIGATRIILMMSLYLLYERITTPRIASVACLIYAANPNFIFYGQQFGYESLSLPLMALTLYLVMRHAFHPANRFTVHISLFILILITAVVVTHHMTSYAVVALLGVWLLVNWLDQRGYLSWMDFAMRRSENVLAWLAERNRVMEWILQQLNLLDVELDQHLAVVRPRSPTILVFFLVAAILTVVWLLKVATITVGYLSPVLGGAIEELLTLISGESGPKETFKAIRGFQAPVWERLISFGTIGLLLLGLPLGWFQTWRVYRRSLPAIVFVILSLLYPVTLAMRMTEKGSETANRSSEFLFIAMGFVLAVAIVELMFKHKVTRIRTAIVVVYMSIMFMGGIITGQAWWARMPGEYVVGGDTLSVQPESIKAAERAAIILGRSNRVIADSLNLKMMASYGEQRIIRRLSWTFFSDVIHEPVQIAYGKNLIRYVIVDERITRYLPINGHYFESNEPDADRHLEPFDMAKLVKYETDPNISRLFDSGNILIYDVIVYRDMPLPESETTKAP